MTDRFQRRADEAWTLELAGHVCPGTGGLPAGHTAVMRNFMTSIQLGDQV